jgi:thioredoxin 1
MDFVLLRPAANKNMAIVITDANFQSEVLEASKAKPVLVDFYADWCTPCQIQGPIVEEVSNEVGDSAVVGKLNTEEAMNVAQKYNIMSIPTLLVFKDGQIAESFIGVQSKDILVKTLKKYI